MSARKALVATAIATAALSTAVLPSTASAQQSQSVTGTTIGATLAIGTPVAATFGTTLGPTSTVDSTGGTVAVTAVGPWIMRVSGTNEGKLAAISNTGLCSGSTQILNNALRVFSSATLGNFTAAGTSGTPLTLTDTAQQVASGTGSNAVTLGYRHVPSSSDQFTAGCAYSLTSTVAIAAS